MRALTIRQPWAWAVVAGHKPVENRSQNVVGEHRGEVLVHAGAQLADTAAFARAHTLTGGRLPMLGAPGAPASTAVGALVGVVTIAGAHRASACRGGCSEWADPTGWHIRLTNPRSLTRPVYCPGRLGLWTPSETVARDARKAGA